MTHSAATQGTAIGGTPGSVDGVRRILDGREGRLRAGTRRIGAAQTQQRAQPRHPILVAANRRNRAQRRGAGPAREAQQHGLRLIIHRVPQQHGCPLAQCKKAQGGETSVTGRGLGASPPIDADGLHERARPEGCSEIRDAARFVSAARPQAMVDRQRHHLNTRTRRHINHRQGKRQ